MDTSDCVDIITNSIGASLVLIPAGEFQMGLPDSDKINALDNDKALHRVEIGTPFRLSVYPVTQCEYEQIIGNNPSHFTGNDRRPVDSVNWFDAVTFCNKLSEFEEMSPFYKISGDDVSIVGGNGYRLPTEAEWEYACRAGTATKWGFGDDKSKLNEYAWFSRNSGCTTHPVGDKKQNLWGLHDMHGNVWEWCWDLYGDYDQSQASDPLGPTKGKKGNCRVLRGGSSFDQPNLMRSAFRDYDRPLNCLHFRGFRLARS